MSMFTKSFAKDTAERVISTAAQALLAVILVDGFNLLNADWAATAGVVGVASLASFLKSVIAAGSTSNTVSPASFAKNDTV